MGPVVVPQTRPFAVIVAFPSEVMFPPETAEVVVIVAMVDVVRTGTLTASGSVVKVTSEPYAVPALLVAKALTKYLVLGDKLVS